MKKAQSIREFIAITICAGLILSGCGTKEDQGISRRGPSTNSEKQVQQGARPLKEQPPFPSDELAAYIAETLHLAGGYPIGWKPIQMRTSHSELSDLSAEFRPEELVSQGWMSPSYEIDRALVYFSVQRPGGAKPLLPSEALDELAALTKTTMTKDGFALQPPTIATVEKVGDSYLHTLYGGQKAVIVEGIADDGTWQCTLFATDRGLTYNLNLSVEYEHLQKYCHLFQLVITHFNIGAVVESGYYGKTWSELRALAGLHGDNVIVFMCGFADINQVFTVAPDGVRINRLTQKGFHWARKHNQTHCVFLASGVGLFSVPLDGSASPRQIADLDDIMSFDLNPEGTQICYSSCMLGNGLWIADIAKPAPRRIIEGLALTPSWSPDGRQIAFSSGKQIKVYSVRGATVKTVPNAEGHCPEWLPDGTGLVFNNDGRFMMTSLVSGSISQLVDAGYTSAASVSSDGRFIAYAAIREGHRDLYVWDRQIGLEVMLFASSLNCEVMDW